MPDQLDELKRQRALVAEHLAWLDRQIAATLAGIDPLPPPAEALRAGGGTAAASVLPPAESPAAGNNTAETDTLFAQFAAEEAPALRPPSKSGCWIIFSVLLLLFLGVVIAVIYSAYR